MHYFKFAVLVVPVFSWLIMRPHNQGSSSTDAQIQKAADLAEKQLHEDAVAKLTEKENQAVAKVTEEATEKTRNAIEKLGGMKTDIPPGNLVPNDGSTPTYLKTNGDILPVFSGQMPPSFISNKRISLSPLRLGYKKSLEENEDRNRVV